VVIAIALERALISLKSRFSQAHEAVRAAFGDRAVMETGRRWVR
jgi:hypothetical protein